MEDEALLAVMVAELLESAGATIVGPAATLQRARVLAESGNIDLALLDVKSSGRKNRPDCGPLFARATPIVFVTGYGEAPAGPWTAAPVIGKPFAEADLLCAIRQALNND